MYQQQHSTLLISSSIQHLSILISGSTSSNGASRQGERKRLQLYWSEEDTDEGNAYIYATADTPKPQHTVCIWWIHKKRME